MTFDDSSAQGQRPKGGETILKITISIEIGTKALRLLGHLALLGIQLVSAMHGGLLK